MAEYDFDLFTIGAGSGGVAASRRAGAYGAKVAICEEVRVGGTCVLRGCVSKKLLVYGSHFHDDFADAEGFGWSFPGAPKLDWQRLVAAKDRELDRLNEVYVRLLRDSGVTSIAGRARVVDPHTVEVAGKRYTAKYILVATGSRPALPSDVRGIDLAITSNEALSLQSLPKRLAIVGGGYIGVELAGVFNAAGVEVTLLLRGDMVLRGFDEDVRSALTAELGRRGIRIRCETVVSDLERRGDVISLMTAAGETLDTDAVLYATGRTPNTAGMGLEDVGVTIAPSGAIGVDAYSRTRVESIFAVGDCTSRRSLTPVAIAEGRAVVETLFRDRPTSIDYTFVPSAVFSQPPVGTVGYTEREARQKFGGVDVFVTSFRPMKGTLSGREERSMMKLVVERATDRVMGCHMVGADAPEIVQGFAVAIGCGATKAEFDATIGIHPTAAEEFVTMREKRPDPVQPVVLPSGVSDLGPCDT
jgi:glutathione reductase (NADPH)